MGKLPGHGNEFKKHQLCFKMMKNLKKASVRLEMTKNLKSINTSENDEEFKRHQFCFKMVKQALLYKLCRGAFGNIVCTNETRLINLPCKHSCLGKAFNFLGESNYSQEMT